MSQPMHTLLICTVGGSPEPIAAALKYWQPSRVHFLPTKETRDQIATRVIPLAEAEGFPLDPGRYDALELHDGQHFASCVERMRQLTPEVERWLRRGEHFQVAVDFTGGTKCMSAALVLQAHRWRCLFSYVGGSERTKEGVGVVVSGREQVLHTQNPWDALGYQAVEEATALFDQGALAAASTLLGHALRNIQDPARKRELNALKTLAETYDAWDRFQHKEALNKLNDLQKSDNDLVAVLGRDRADKLRAQTAVHRTWLGKIRDHSGPTRELVIDLLGNALRRRREGRYDDAVARLYRALEAIAQVRLAEGYGISDTKVVPLGLLPEPLHTEWAGRADGDTVFLGLQDAYKLLHALGEALGRQFQQLGLHHDSGRSPVVSRNRSILAHGFEPVGEKVFDQLWNSALQLVQVQEVDLPAFPGISG
jgi:CRISPR-associated protein (TIGR02710 family)